MRILEGGRISYLFIFVRDIERMLSFYRDFLGFNVTFLQEGHCAFLELPAAGTLQLALYSGRQTATRVDPNHWFVVIDVDDLDAVEARVQAQGIENSGTFDVPYGRALKITDPEGNFIQLHEPNKQ